MAYTSTVTFGNTSDGSAPLPNAIAVEAIILSFENETSMSSDSGGAGAGKVTFNPFTFTKSLDAASVILFEACAAGTAFGKVTLNIHPVNASIPRFTYVFKLAIVSQLNIAGNQHAGSAPTETVAIEYGAVELEYNDQSSSGSGTSISGGWNRVTNTPS